MLLKTNFYLQYLNWETRSIFMLRVLWSYLVYFFYWTVSITNSILFFLFNGLDNVNMLSFWYQLAHKFHLNRHGAFLLSTVGGRFRRFFWLRRHWHYMIENRRYFHHRNYRQTNLQLLWQRRRWGANRWLDAGPASAMFNRSFRIIFNRCYLIGGGVTKLMRAAALFILNRPGAAALQLDVRLYAAKYRRLSARQQKQVIPFIEIATSWTAYLQQFSQNRLAAGMAAKLTPYLLIALLRKYILLQKRDWVVLTTPNWYWRQPYLFFQQVRHARRPPITTNWGVYIYFRIFYSLRWRYRRRFRFKFRHYARRPFLAGKYNRWVAGPQTVVSLYQSKIHRRRAASRGFVLPIGRLGGVASGGQAEARVLTTGAGSMLATRYRSSKLYRRRLTVSWMARAAVVCSYYGGILVPTPISWSKTTHWTKSSYGVTGAEAVYSRQWSHNKKRCGVLLKSRPAYKSGCRQQAWPAAPTHFNKHYYVRQLTNRFQVGNGPLAPPTPLLLVGPRIYCNLPTWLVDRGRLLVAPRLVPLSWARLHHSSTTSHAFYCRRLSNSLLFNMSKTRFVSFARYRPFFINLYQLPFIGFLNMFLFIKDTYAVSRTNLPATHLHIYKIRIGMAIFNISHSLERLILKRQTRQFFQYPTNYRPHHTFANPDGPTLQPFERRTPRLTRQFMQGNVAQHDLLSAHPSSQNWYKYARFFQIRQSVMGNMEFRIRRIRFRPGYSTLWRRARNDLKLTLNLPYQYQRRLTTYLVRFNRFMSIKLLLQLELQLFNILIRSRLFPSQTYIMLFLNRRWIYVNGLVVVNPLYQLYTNDLIQLITSLRYYILYRWLLNWSIRQKLRLKKRLYRAYQSYLLSDDKQRPKHFPHWIRLSKNVDEDVGRYLEVDLFSLSAIVIYEPTLWTDLNFYTIYDYKINILNVYNWKYIT